MPHRFSPCKNCRLGKVLHFSYQANDLELNNAMQYPQPTTAGMYGSLRRPATRQYSQRCDALPGEMCEHRMMAPPAMASDYPESEGGGGGGGGVNRMSMTHSLNAMMPPPMPSLMLPQLHPTTAAAAPPVGILRNRYAFLPYFLRGKKNHPLHSFQLVEQV